MPVVDHGHLADQGGLFACDYHMLRLHRISVVLCTAAVPHLDHTVLDLLGTVLLPCTPRTDKMKTTKNEQRALEQCCDLMGQHILCVSVYRNPQNC